MAADEASAVIDRFGLAPHPEGGWFRRTWTHPDRDAHDRPLGSSILYLLRAGEVSHWHRIDAVELWQFVAGAPIVLSIADDTGAVTGHVLGTGPGQHPQAVVPARRWQSARPAPDAPFCLVACVVVPGFVEEGFELAPPAWVPGDRS